MLVVGNEYSGWVRLDGSAVEGTPDGAVGTLLKHESGLAAERSAEAMRLLHSGHPAQAVQLLEAAAVLDSENPQALARVGLAHFNSGRPLAAIACVRQAQAKARVQGNTWLADALDAFVLQAQERSAALGGVDAPLASSPPSGVTEGFCEIPQ
jgi:tetratricopeptide (TPR) repeat protein